MKWRPTKAPPQRKSGGRREGPCQRASRTSSERSIAQTPIPIQDPYTYAGDHPRGFKLYDHPIRGRCRAFGGYYHGLTTDELDALEAYEREVYEDSLVDEPDPRERPLRGVSRGVRLGRGEW